MSWAGPKYSRTNVDNAGMTILRTDETKDELERAYEIVNDWRAAHAYPLQNFQINLRAKVNRIQEGAIVAQRLKRLESIIAKLSRAQTRTLKLSQMQDIGGCRAVLKSMNSVNTVLNSYLRKSRFSHVLIGHKDYINNPKEDGYRGHHLIYQYKSSYKESAAYDKLRIEMQIRTEGLSLSLRRHEMW